QIRSHPGDEHKQERNRQELETESRIMWRSEAQNEEKRRQQQRRGVAEVPRPWPQQIGDQRRGRRQNERWAHLPHTGQQLLICSSHAEHLPCKSEKGRVTKPLPESIRPEAIGRENKYEAD